MHTIINTQKSKEKYAFIALLFFSFTILVLLTLDLQQTKTIDLSSSDLTVIDDRTIKGKSVGSVIKRNHGVDFTCLVKSSELTQPFCKLLIDVRNLTQSSSLTGLDLSNYDQIGLWLTHNHPSQAGTRLELHNFNNAYSLSNKQSTLKHNTIEYLEAFIASPVWLKLDDFSVPQWWNNRYNLSLTHGGTDFSNIYYIVLAPSIQVNEGKYQLTIKRIELRGSYISPTALVTLLITLWSSAFGYLIHRLYADRRNTREEVEHATHIIEFGVMNCHVTGALNRVGLRKCFDVLVPSDLHHLSIILLSIDNLEDIQAEFGVKLADKTLKLFVDELNNVCRSSDTVARWSNDEFLIVCPDTALEQALNAANKVSVIIQEKRWPKRIELTSSSGVAQMYDEHLHDLIKRAQKALIQSKSDSNKKVSAA